MDFRFTVYIISEARAAVEETSSHRLDVLFRGLQGIMSGEHRLGKQQHVTAAHISDGLMFGIANIFQIRPK